MTTEIHTKNQIVFRMDEQPEEMLRIAEDGFYVRGVKVPVDDKEAEAVYNSFQQWLAWAQLRRDRKSTRLNSSHSQQSRMPSSA